MPSDLTISAIGIPAAFPPPAIPARAPSYQPSATATVEPKVAGPPPPSPTLRFDATAGILVIEFHDDAGQVTNSIPTQRQLQAYRTQSDVGPAPAPQPTNAAADSGAAAALPAATTPDLVANAGIVGNAGIVTTSGVVA